MPITPEQVASVLAHVRGSDGFTPDEMARLKAMSDEQIERGALDDPDAAPASQESLDRAIDARNRRQNDLKTAV